MESHWNKEDLRRDKKEWRNRLDPEQAKERSQKLADRLWQSRTKNRMGQGCLKDLDAYLCYAALGNEVCLNAHYERLLHEGKKLYFPRTQGKEMEFFLVEDLSRDFVRGKFGILEPTGKEPYTGDQKAMAFIPGVVFDIQGNRMGYGGGFYDRFLCRHHNIVKIGICYEKQLTEYIVPEPWDIAMDAVVTENRVIDRCERSRQWN